MSNARKKMTSASCLTPFGVIAKRVFPSGIIFVNLKETPDALIQALVRVQHGVLFDEFPLGRSMVSIVQLGIREARHHLGYRVRA